MIEPAEKNWAKAWKSPVQRAQIVMGFVPLLITLGCLPVFFNHIQKRNGITLTDPILAAIPPHNVSIPIFAIIWGIGILVIIRAIKEPTIFIYYCWTLLLVTLVRLLTISLVPLNPPVGIVIISDPLTNLFYGQHVVTKDLFFSGHTAIMTISTLCLQKKSDKIIGTILTILLGTLLLVQHIHYTLDVVAAPIIAYLMYKIVKWLLNSPRVPFSSSYSIDKVVNRPR